jgi:hypothetical protein
LNGRKGVALRERHRSVLHHAIYQFTDKTALDRAIEGPDMKRLVADFNRDWLDVTRTREVLVLAEELAPA